MDKNDNLAINHRIFAPSHLLSFAETSHLRYFSILGANQLPWPAVTPEGCPPNKYYDWSLGVEHEALVEVYGMMGTQQKSRKPNCTPEDPWNKYVP